VDLNVAFRVAATAQIGGGHVARCLTLADAFAQRGAACSFFVNGAAARAVPLLARTRHAVVTADTTEDLLRAATRAGNVKFDWMVVDDYRLSAPDEAAFRRVAKKIFVVDDLADRPHDCDVLLDSTLGRTSETYAGLVPRNAKVLAGAQFAPLRSEFFAARPRTLIRRQATKVPSRLLVSFGLVDPEGVTGEAVEALLSAFPDLAIDAVLAPRAASLGQVEKLARTHKNLRLHVDPPSMAALMSDADLALGAGGSTAFERACLALPTVAIVLASNQTALAGNFAAAGAQVAIPKDGAVWRRTVEALRALIRDHAVWEDMCLKASRICDGLGARRAALIAISERTRAGGNVSLRPACWDDVDRLFEWQSAPGARTYSSDPSPPKRPQHEAWLKGKLANPNCVLTIVEFDGDPVGVLRFDRRLNGSFMVSILISTSYHGAGIGLAAMRAGAVLLSGHTLWAVIDDRNAASIRMFANAGFEPCGEGKYMLVNGAPSDSYQPQSASA
jgi:UDP-2,4-diacetamido-2,4,6-trideoxy-beta-L-altropyranose hydrolase